jgi:protein-disulfide isomerase
MNKNTLIITTLAILGMFAFLAGAYFMTSAPDVKEYEELKVLGEKENTKWSKTNSILLVEYSDLQCPGCQYAHQLLKQLESDPDFPKIKERITFVYRHFPLDAAHPNARKAAHAAEAAAKQNKFFEWTDLLFTKQGEWGPKPEVEETFMQYAKDLKLNEDQFKKDMNSQETKDQVQKDFLSGSEFNVPGTPTFFLNGKLLESPQNVEAFKALLLNEIK